ncbi:hypothetical protein [Celeribacter sp. PS-C1]|uniref:hypothetical protein n=1 Tax=Celeribacter sp. PS-C1 TaxID=2820813 RepID=UPI001CA50AC0|nr:hypothetical protein [Celeribacter sp. PS-C1]MBW6416869.1 hypothetical protein [Celeribacter sp. PS-C1]
MPTNTLQGYDVYDFSTSTGSIYVGPGDTIALDPALVPGVTYTVTAIDNVNAGSGTAPAYADIATSHYDQDQGVYFDSGTKDDELTTGAGDDVIEAGAGAGRVCGACRVYVSLWGRAALCTRLIRLCGSTGKAPCPVFAGLKRVVCLSCG